ncbi:MAG: FAD-binding protein [Spirochaetes bacterium]|nr:FAD-binding protein [Spirochaetota bacterium]
MAPETVTIDGIGFPLVMADVAVVGSGAAALNAAIQCRRRGIERVIIVTDRMGGGTTANAGSDKQTYYRVNPAGDSGDSSFAMARELFDGGCMHGDVALVESALSDRAFYHLVELGVPFPHDGYGNYPGFRTDHDLRSRGISAGPETSRRMFEALRGEAATLGIPVLDHTRVIELCTRRNGEGRKSLGLIAVDRRGMAGPSLGITAVACGAVVLGTGGPASLFHDSVYPSAQTGSLGVALRAGAVLQNLSECQFGIASTAVRWNLSGSFQQVLPRYVSCRHGGSDEREFLCDAFPSADLMLTAQFLKGYQWPFDAEKIGDYGSSRVDLLVYYETRVRGRRVYLDYRRNPSFRGAPCGSEGFPELPRGYLDRSGALQETPVARLRALNLPAYEFYRDRGIDLAERSIEAALCHQHMNGGIRGSLWWESGVRNLFPVGECCGTHGVRRPGGSALNAGQVGGIRIAECIAERPKITARSEEERDSVIECLRRKYRFLASLLSPGRRMIPDNAAERVRRRMSRSMGIIRNRAALEGALGENRRMWEESRDCGAASPEGIMPLLELQDLLLTERAFLENTLALLQRLNGGRGSFLVAREGDVFIIDSEERCTGIREAPLDRSLGSVIVETSMDAGGRFFSTFVPVRPVPDPDSWFENVWRRYRERNEGVNV